MEVAGYMASIFIGISLGLIGGGGSILTVPVLVYLFNVDTVLATVYSLFIVGTTSIVGSFSYFKKGLVNLKIAFFFGIPSVLSIFFTKRFLLPAIPVEIFSIGKYMVTRDILLMLLFALLMIAASYSMIRKDQQEHQAISPKQLSNYPQLLLQGVFIGALTGLIGAGGGFLIIPALVNLLKLPVKTAVGTSLAIISINSITGFWFSLSHYTVHWDFLLGIAAVAVIGILIGSYLSAKVKATLLKPAFGWFVLAMGLYIVIKETLLK